MFTLFLLRYFHILIVEETIIGRSSPSDLVISAQVRDFSLVFSFSISL